ncbi:hypothetical protein CHELA40_40170 [Chelatococcus asaccharovorans]|nr:hypothetical protein CHELA40_40170 [Chelatococcus asaccharovorans]
MQRRLLLFTRVRLDPTALAGLPFEDGPYSAKPAKTACAARSADVAPTRGSGDRSFLRRA